MRRKSEFGGSLATRDPESSGLRLARRFILLRPFASVDLTAWPVGREWLSIGGAWHHFAKKDGIIESQVLTPNPLGAFKIVFVVRLLRGRLLLL